MNRVLLMLLGGGLLLATPATAQYRSPRSADYLFGASTWGARALWVNPAAQGSVDEASIMLEGLVERTPSGSFPLSQYTIGFNSRGFGFAFRRDFFDEIDAGIDTLVTRKGNTWRVGFGRGLGPLAIGAAVSIYSGPNTRQGVDLGLIYRAAPGLGLAFGLQNIGQPVVRDTSLRFTGVAGLSWTGLRGIVGLDLEARAADQWRDGGVLMGYRGGLRIGTGGNLRLALVSAVDLGNSFNFERLLLGLSLGGEYLGNVVAGGARQEGTNRLTSVSVLGLASKGFR